MLVNVFECGLGECFEFGIVAAVQLVLHARIMYFVLCFIFGELRLPSFCRHYISAVAMSLLIKMFSKNMYTSLMFASINLVVLRHVAHHALPSSISQAD